MIKCEAIENFTLKRYNEIKMLKRKSTNSYGNIYTGDVFECEKEMVEYLSGKNSLGKTVIKVIEVKPKEQPTPKKKTSKK